MFKIVPEGRAIWEAHPVLVLLGWLMARRPADEQALHDRVISAIFKLLSNAGRIAETNPGPLRMITISGYYPDVLAALVHERNDIVQAIYEVETWSTVEEKHAEHQWTAFAGLGVMFFLVVPDDTLDEAGRIVSQLGIEVKLVGFRESDDGAITFDQEVIPPLKLSSRLITTKRRRTPRMPRRSRSKIDQSPLAVTSSNVILGLGYTHDLRTVAQAISLLRSDEITGTLFLGVVLEGSKGARALKQFEDASAEIAATTPVGRGRSRRGQR